MSAPAGETKPRQKCPPVPESDTLHRGSRHLFSQRIGNIENVSSQVLISCFCKVHPVCRMKIPYQIWGWTSLRSGGHATCVKYPAVLNLGIPTTNFPVAVLRRHLVHLCLLHAHCSYSSQQIGSLVVGGITTFIDSGWAAIRGKVRSKTALRDESGSLKR